MRRILENTIWVLLLVMTLLVCGACTDKKASLSKEELCLKVEEMQKELEELLPFLEELDEKIVIRNDPHSTSETWVYYMDFENELLNQIVETFRVRSLGQDKEDTIYDQKNISFSCETKSGEPVEYRGFYYVENGQPVGWSGRRYYYPAQKEGKGYIYLGSGVYYTEKITDHWYYYEMSGYYNEERYK